MAALVASLVYVNALGNRWAIDDPFLVRDNAAAHDVPTALSQFFEPYWPTVEGARAGLYRPMAVLSYAIDWTISGGAPWWFHATNALLHGFATALVVLVLLRWLTLVGALTGGLLFAVHPVHVEAVANVIGRTEVMAASGMLLAVLAARRFRRADERHANRWLIAVLAATATALFSKEHAVVTIGVLIVDQWLDPERSRRSTLGLYLSVTALTVGWLFLWRAIAAEYAEATVAAGIRWLSPWERIATAVPAQLDLVRLLVWPMQLAADYSPLVIPQRTEWGLVASIAAVTSGALLALAFAVSRKAPAVAFGILVAAGSFLPTSNLFFPAGIVMAERTLYLAAIAPAAVLGWVVSKPALHFGARERRMLGGAVALILVVFTVRTLTRTPVWRDTATTVTRELLRHPENYRAHVWLSEVYAVSGDSVRALRELLTATELFEDPFTTRLLVPIALARGARSLALGESVRAYARSPGHPELTRFLVDSYLALGKRDSAIAVLRHSLTVEPGNRGVAEDYALLLTQAQAPEWQQQFARLRLQWLGLRLSTVGPGLDSAVAAAGAVSDLSEAFCWEVNATLLPLKAFRPELIMRLRTLAAERGLDCEEGV